MSPKLILENKKTKIVILSSALVAGAMLFAQQQVSASTLTSNEYKQISHYNIPQGFMNDIQSIFKGNDGYYHIYYLSNNRFKNSNDGTEWFHVKTKDFKHYEDVGIAIPKFQNGWEAMATGSVVKNDSGFYKDLPKTAIVAYFTSYTPQGQNQYVAYSTDDGKTYKQYNGTQPIMKGASASSDNRDPYVEYNAKTGKMMMYLAEGDKIGTYSSSNGKDFHYEGATILNKFSLGGKDLGVIECPNLKTLTDSAGHQKYIMYFGANGYNYGQTTGTYYMVGHLDDKGVFVSEQSPQRVDDGSDYYGSNFMQDGKSLNKSIGWLGNWGYTTSLKDDDGSDSQHIGSFTTARSIQLTGTKSGDWRLGSWLTRDLSTETNSVSGTAKRSTAPKSDGFNSDFLDTNRWVSQKMDFQFAGETAGTKVNGHIQLNFKQKDGTVRLDYNADNGYYEVTRTTTNKFTGDAKNTYERGYVENSELINPKQLNITVTSDKDSLEFEFGQNGKTYTMAKFSTDSQIGVNVKTSGSNNLAYKLSNVESK